MSSISLNEEQTQLLRLCLKNAEPLKPNWQPVAEGLGDKVSQNAASQRWGRLYKILIGDEKSSSPTKGKGAASKVAKGSPKPKVADKPPLNLAANVPAPEYHQDDAQIVCAAQPGTPTPKKKRAREADADEDGERKTDLKPEETGIKQEE